MQNILIVTGTNRESSNTKLVTDCVLEIYKQAGSNAEILNLAEIGSEWFEPGNYPVRNNKDRPEVKKWLEADGLVMVLPEYNGSYPGVIKYFIDMLPFPDVLLDKPATFIGLSAGHTGGMYSVGHLQTVFMNRRAFIYPVSVFIPAINDALINSELAENYIKRITSQADGFLDFVKKLKS